MSDGNRSCIREGVFLYGAGDISGCAEIVQRCGGAPPNQATYRIENVPEKYWDNGVVKCYTSLIVEVFKLSSRLIVYPQKLSSDYPMPTKPQ